MEQRGEVLTALLAYAGGQEPPEMSSEARVAFAFFRVQLDMDAQKYEEICRKRAEAGRAGGRPRKDENQMVFEKANGFFENQTKAKKPDNDNDNDLEKPPTNVGVKKKTERFCPPTVDDVKGYCDEKGLKVDAERFVDFYGSKGWKVGNSPMKDWRAAVRNWARQDKERGGSAGSWQKENKRKTAFFDFDQRDNDLDAELLARIRRPDKREVAG